MPSVADSVRALGSMLLFFKLFSLIFSSFAFAAPVSTTTAANPYPSELKVFKYIPLFTPYSISIAQQPLQFNGSVPGAGDMDEHVGWYSGEIPPTEHKPVDLVSFVQYNKKEGIVFWAENTALQTYLAPVPGAEGTYAVRNGWTEDEKLTNSFTLEKYSLKQGEERWLFGWEGNYHSWFVCGSKESGFFGLYYGNHINGCSKPFLIEAQYL